MAGEQARQTGTGRVEAFSDGVIAIALTLLVLDLTGAHTSGEYTAELLRDWPAYLAYLAAFLTIASMWLSHHAAFSRLVRVDPTVLVLNLGLLLGIALIPWPTSLLAAALADRDPADERAAVVVYVVVSLVVALAWFSLSSTIARRPQLFAEPDAGGWFRENARRSIVAGPISVVAGAIGFLVPIVAVVVFLLVPLAFLVFTMRERGTAEPAGRGPARSPGLPRRR